MNTSLNSIRPENYSFEGMPSPFSSKISEENVSKISHKLQSTSLDSRMGRKATDKWKGLITKLPFLVQTHSVLLTKDAFVCT